MTEDLDLSYRAQAAGWRFIYLHDCVAISELPTTLSAFRGQQQRWTKGSIQTARKILPALLSSDLSAGIKIEALFHPLANTCRLFGTVATLTLYPTIRWRVGGGPHQILWLDVPLFAAASGFILLYFLLYTAQNRKFGALIYIPLVPALCIGICPCLSLAVLEGFFRRGGVFNRTPKCGSGMKSAVRSLFPLYHEPAASHILANTPLLLYSRLPSPWSEAHMSPSPFSFFSHWVFSLSWERISSSFFQNNNSFGPVGQCLRPARRNHPQIITCHRSPGETKTLQALSPPLPHG